MSTGWRANAKCKGKDTSFFFPASTAEEEKNKAYCQDCPVQIPCLEAGMANMDEGIFGGTTAAERNRMKRRSRLEARQRRSA